MATSALSVLAEAAAQERELPVPAWAFGLGALVAFAALFAVTWAFRSVANRH